MWKRKTPMWRKKVRVEVDGIGSMTYYMGDIIHRAGDEPAVIRPGFKMWVKNGKIHRDNCKPAKIFDDGRTEYWWKGKRMMIPEKCVLFKSVGECSICIDHEKKDVWIETFCNHKFHYSCLSRWLESKKSCPLCREYVG